MPGRYWHWKVAGSWKSPRRLDTTRFEVGGASEILEWVLKALICLLRHSGRSGRSGQGVGHGQLLGCLPMNTSQAFAAAAFDAVDWLGRFEVASELQQPLRMHVQKHWAHYCHPDFSACRSSDLQRPYPDVQEVDVYTTGEWSLSSALGAYLPYGK